jgi:diguanylate cyclase (GGDEF)-like protein/hemerythrin-like metal-binding protein/PAS domain S-box-containing protein
MKSIDIFPWNENFNTGIDEIDEQHQRLVKLLNILASHVAFKSDLPGLEQIFNELAEYAVYHFETEERIWHRYLPQDSLEQHHKAGHSSFIDSVSTLKIKYEGESEGVVLEQILGFLTRWLASHILESDRHLAMVVLAIKDGMPLADAKTHANEKMLGTTRVLIDIILSIYESLSNNTLQLMRELEARKQAEIQLKQRENFLFTIIENEPDCIKIVNRTGIVTQMNPAGLKIVEADNPQQVIGLSVYELIEPEYHQQFQALHKKVLAGQTQSLEFEITTLKGKKRWMDTHAVYLEDVNGEPVQLAVTRDISQNKQLENQLRIAATVFESQEGMIVTDAENNIIRVNKAFTEITGYEPEEVTGMNPGFLKSAKQPRSFYRKMWKNILKNGVWEGEIWNRRKNGEVFPEYLTIKAVLNDTGEVTHYVGTLTDITLRKAAADEIEKLAFYDPLTELPNRRLLHERLRLTLSLTQRNGHHGALLFLDLDNFKTLNDTLGHDMGDILLKSVAARLQEIMQENDTVARLGGDEFVIMLEDLSADGTSAAEQAELIGQKILHLFITPFCLGIQQYAITPSIGIALFRGHEKNPMELLKHADLAMYQAKSAGRNALRFFDPQMHENVIARVSLERELKLALEQRQFQLFFQVQTDRQAQPIGAEALIRWIHPVKGVQSPDKFIPIAEENGIIIPLGLWIIEACCIQLQAWQRSPGLTGISISINISPKQFFEKDFFHQVRSILKRYAIDTHLLKFELTESIMIDDIEDTISTMTAFCDLGIQFSLDDFGTGYSSLQYLKKLPFSQLKIDRSFVCDLAHDANDQAIVKTIIAMAQSLNMNVIAEGVESQQQFDYLDSLGCEFFQGYLLGRPEPADIFETQMTLANV